MKKYRVPFFLLICIFVIRGMSYADTHTAMKNRNGTDAAQTENLQLKEEDICDKIPMVMAGGKLYYDTGKESNLDARCGVMDGEITSVVDANRIPEEDNQSNFGFGYGYQYGIDNTIEVSIDDKWYVFEENSLICYEDVWYRKEELSKKTIQWLNWYNGLTEEEQSFINYVPSELTAVNDKNVKTMETNDCVFYRKGASEIN